MTLENDTQEQDDFDADVAKQREARARESTLVFTVVSSIATPLAHAFRSMRETGLLTTRYQLYCDAVNAILTGKHCIPFQAHDVHVPSLLDHIWRTAKETP